MTFGRSAAAGLIALLVLAAPAVAAPGDLDETFSDDGLVGASALGSASAVAVQPDSAIVVGGATDPSGSRVNPFLARYLPEGSLDSGFGEGGVARLDLGSLAQVVDLFVQPDGRIVAAGRIGDGGLDGDFLALRLLPDGSLDPSFGGDGSARVDFGGYFDNYAAAALQADGRIVVVGSGWDGTGDPSGSIAVARFQPDGSLDASFSGDGRLLLDLGERSASANAVVARPGGSVLLAGTTAEPFSDEGDLFVVRLQPNGDLDPSFGDGGMTTADFGLGDFAAALALQADGRVVVAGDSCTSEFLRYRCLALAGRFTADGALDPSFAGDGTVVFGEDPPLTRVGAATAVALQADGAILVGGTVDHGPPFHRNFAVRRLTPDGSIDRDFSADGLVSTDFDLGVDHGEALALAPDGRIIASGGDLGDRLGLARYEVGAGPPDADADGLLDDRDRCPVRFAKHRTGCPRIDRKLRISRRAGGGLRGRLEAETRRCAIRQRVKVFRLRPGADKGVAKTRTSAKSRGRWKLERGAGKGRLYAVASRSRDPGIGRCTRVKSRKIRI